MGGVLWAAGGSIRIPPPAANAPLGARSREGEKETGGRWPENGEGEVAAAAMLRRGAPT